MPAPLSPTRVAALAALLLTAACSSTPPSAESIGESRSAIEAARASGADDAQIADIAIARDKLARAEAAARAGDHVTARRLAEQAALDAQVARSKVAAEKSHRAITEIDANLAALREEMNRNSLMITSPVKP